MPSASKGLPEPWEYGRFESVGLVPVVDYFTEADYSWAVSAVFYHPESKSYRFATDSGCSCNGPWDSSYSLDDFGPALSSAVARRMVQADPCTGDFTPDMKTQATLAVSAFARAARGGRSVPGLLNV